MITAVRGRGLFIAFDLPDPGTRDEFWKGLFDRGLLVLKSGERSIRFRPALDITTEVVDEAIDLLRAQCQQTRIAVAGDASDLAAATHRCDTRCTHPQETRSRRRKSRRLLRRMARQRPGHRKVFADRRQAARARPHRHATPTTSRPSRARRKPSRSGASRPGRSAAKRCGSSATRCAKLKSELGQLVTLEIGQDHRRRRRRSAGDDRHLRLRGRPVAHALRPDDSIRAPEPSPDGAVASARCGRRHLRLQFSRRRLVLERRAGGGLR